MPGTLLAVNGHGPWPHGAYNLGVGEIITILMHVTRDHTWKSYMITHTTMYCYTAGDSHIHNFNPSSSALALYVLLVLTTFDV